MGDTRGAADLTHLVRVDPRFATWHMPLTAFRLTFGARDSDGDHTYRFVARAEADPEYGFAGGSVLLMLLDSDGLATGEVYCSVHPTVDPTVMMLEHVGYTQCLPAEVQVVFVPE